jgi:hypothetical protein
MKKNQSLCEKWLATDFKINRHFPINGPLPQKWSQLYKKNLPDYF